MHSTDLKLAFHFERHATKTNFEFFGKARSHFNGVILTRNSPLKRILQNTLLELNEKGVVSKAQRGIGRIPVSKAPDLYVLSAGQTVLAFILLAGGGLLVCVSW